MIAEFRLAVPVLLQSAAAVGRPRSAHLEISMLLLPLVTQPAKVRSVSLFVLPELGQFEVDARRYNGTRHEIVGSA